MLNYTKGNWYIWHTNNMGDIVQTTKQQIAQVVQAHGFDKEGQLEAAANARLIAAAPDMYEALKALIAHFRNNDENYYKSDLCTDAINALRKVEGKDGNKE